MKGDNEEEIVLLRKTLVCQRAKADNNYSTATTATKNKAVLGTLYVCCLLLFDATSPRQGRFPSTCFVWKETGTQNASSCPYPPS